MGMTFLFRNYFLRNSLSRIMFPVFVKSNNGLLAKN